MNETTFKNGSLIVPMGTGRYGVRKPVLLVVEKNAEGEILRAFYRISFDGHVVEATNRKELKAKVEATFNSNKDRRWFKFLIPSLETHQHGVPGPGYHKVIADACMFDVMEPSYRGQNKPGTRVRHLDQSNKKRYLQENQPAIADSGHGQYLPDTKQVRTQVERIQRTLTRAVKKAHDDLEKLFQKNRRECGDEYTGDKE